MFVRAASRGQVSAKAPVKRRVVSLRRVRLARSAGVQLHPPSLPAGRLGPEAYAWVDWLAEAGQRWWQMLPLSPPDRHGSPYKSRSAFARWPGLPAGPPAPVSKAEEPDLPGRGAGWVGGRGGHARGGGGAAPG